MNRSAVWGSLRSFWARVANVRRRDRRIPLVRAEGKIFDEGYPTLGAAEFVSETPLLRESRSDRSREAEAAFGFEACLYFYVGWSHPSFGDVVLLYEPDRFDADSGGATPFDSGGFYLDYIKVVGVQTAPEKLAYVHERNVALDAWRREFGRYVSRHFASVKAYVLGDRPTSDDVSHRLRDASERRAWTWEVRLERDHPVMEHLRCAYLSHDYAEEVRERLRGLTPAAMALWYGRFRDGIIRAVDLGQCPHRVAVDEIAGALP